MEERNNRSITSSSSKRAHQNISNVHLAYVRHVDQYSDEDSVKEAMDRYDEELKSLAETSASVAAQRNAISQNLRIPPEILSHIFRFVADLHPTIHDDPPPSKVQVANARRSLPGWLPLSQVCRRWRDVAQAHRTLQTEVTYATSIAWLREHLAHVQHLPVTLHRYIPRGSSSEPESEPGRIELNLINDHISHIKELVILMNPKSYTTLSVHLTNAAPILESLTLSRYRIGMETTGDRDSIVDYLPDNLFAGEMPALRRLALRGFFFSWDTSPLLSESLTHFELSLPEQGLVEDLNEEGFLQPIAVDNGLGEPDFVMPEPDPLQEPSHAQLFLCLERMPVLQSLKLENFCPIPSGDPWPDTLLFFPHLRKLELIGNDSSCAGFLEHVRIPSGASVSVSVTNSSSVSIDDTGFMPLFNSLSSHVNWLSDRHHISAATFQLNAIDRTAGLKLWGNQISGARAADNSEAWQSIVNISYDLGASAQSACPTVTLCWLASLLSLPDLQVLSFSCIFERTKKNLEVMAEVLMQLCGQFPSVRHLFLNMRAACVLTQAMSINASNVNPPDGVESDLPPPFFRGLTAISLLDTSRNPNALGALKFLRFSPEGSHFHRRFARYLAALRRDQGQLQVLNIGWQDIEDWRAQFGKVVPVRPLPAAIERYMDCHSEPE